MRGMRDLVGNWLAPCALLAGWIFVAAYVITCLVSMGAAWQHARQQAADGVEEERLVELNDEVGF